MKHPFCLFLVVLFNILFLTLASLQVAAYSMPRVTHPVLRPMGEASVLRTKLKEIMSRSETEVLQGFSTVGPTAGMNAEYLAEVEELAQLYYLTKDKKAARLATVMLYKFSQVSMEFPVTNRSGQPTRPLPSDWQEIGHSMGKVWSTWFYYDPGEIAKLSRTYDLIYDSGELEKYGKELNIDLIDHLEKYFDYWWRVYTVYWPPNWQNVEGCRIWHLLAYAEPLGHPEYIREIIRWVDRYLLRGYFYDGYWREGSPHYHYFASSTLEAVMNRLQGYSDPPGYVDPVEGDRIEDFDAISRWGSVIKRILNARQLVRLPNGQYVIINDSDYGESGSALAESSPVLIPGLGYAILGTGEGKNQFQVHLNFLSPWGHEHKGGLGIVLYANGEELLSEGEYQGNRDWQSSTAGHNTVVVDGRNQFTRTQGVQLPITYGDRSIPTIDWDSIHASNGNRASLLAYDAQADSVMMVEAEGSGLYGAPVTAYRRMIVSVPRPGDTPYVLDVFRVAGGNTHDWMIHGPLQSTYQITSNINLQARSGGLFNYIGNLQSGTSSDDIQVDICAAGGSGDLVTLLAGAKSSELTIGSAPAMRRNDEASFASLRRMGTDNVFVAVHNPYGKDGENPLAVKALSSPVAWNDPVVVEVEGSTFRDLLITTTDGPGAYVPRQFAGVTVAARFAWLRFDKDGTLQEAKLVGGGYIKVGEKTLQADGDWQGEAIGAGRKEAGAIGNYIDVNSPLPAGSQLTGRLLILTLSDGSRQGYTITEVKENGAGSRVFVEQDTGLEWAEGGVNQVFFPNRHLSEKVEFEIFGRLQYSSGYIVPVESVNRALLHLEAPGLDGKIIAKAQGQLPVSITITPWSGRQLQQVSVLIDDVKLYEGKDAPPSGSVMVETLHLVDGSHKLKVMALDDAGMLAQRQVTINVDNWWSQVDELLPPIQSGFFGETEIMITDKSSGWRQATTADGCFSTDETRRVRSGDTAEYMIWEAPKLHQFKVLLYAKDENVVDGLEFAVSSDDSRWEQMPFTVTYTAVSEGWKLFEVTGTVPVTSIIGTRTFRLAVKSGMLTNGLQVGSVELLGMN